MFCKGAPGDCGRAEIRASGGSACAGVGASMSESGCEDAAIVLACDMRQTSLCTGLRDLLWFLLDIAFTNTGWPRKVSKRRSTPAVTSVEKPRRRHKKQNKAASAGTTEDQPGGDTGLGYGRTGKPSEKPAPHACL